MEEREFRQSRMVVPELAYVRMMCTSFVKNLIDELHIAHP